MATVNHKARMKLRGGVPLTLQHVTEGIPKDPCRCPYALAYKDAGFPNVQVADKVIYLDGRRGGNVIYMSEEDILAVQAYDEGRAMLVPGTIFLAEIGRTAEELQRMRNDERRHTA